MASLSLSIILVVGVLTSVYIVQPVRAQEIIYIRADGSIDPPTAPITTADNITYIFIDNVSSDADGIVVERDNIVVDGAFHVLQGSGTGNGVVLVGRSNVTLRNLQISAFSTGVILGSGDPDHISRCVISGNNITSNKDYGIKAVDFSSSNIFSGNNITNNGYGIYFNGEQGGEFNNNSITQNQASNNSNAGILFFGSYGAGGGSSFNVISGNILANNTLGIKMMWGENNTVSGNQIAAIEDGVSLVQNWYSVIFGNNITSINGNGVILGADWGYHFVADCKFTIVSRNRIEVENGNGVAISGCEYNTVSGNNITVAEGSGVYLSPYFADDFPFFEVVPSCYNLISDNNLTGNRDGDGIFLSSAFYNNISRNSVRARYNMYLYNSDNNSIYHNSFVNWAIQVYSFNSANVWDDGYPSGGNYWSDYTGVDANGDGIGDTPYVIYADVIGADDQDRFPLMHPWSPLPVRNMNTGLGYATIQEAINAASDGDTIFVRNGTYYEHLIIDRTLRLVGENRNSTIIDNEYKDPPEMIGSVVLVAADNVKMSGFTIQHCRSGGNALRIENCVHMTFSDNIIKGNNEGIRLTQTSGNVVSNNIIRDCYYNTGLAFNYAHNNTVYNNTIIGNPGIGIGSAYESYDNVFLENTIRGNGYGLLVSLYNCSFFHNNIIYNSVQASFYPGDYSNSWDNGYPSGGNYWSDYTGVDSNGDGIGDTPYIIDSNNQDNYPLMHAWNGSIMPLAHLSLLPQNYTARFMRTFTVNVTIANVTNLYGYEFKAHWNETLLDLISVSITPPAAWGSNYIVVKSNVSDSTYWHSLSALAPAPAFNGSTTLVSLAFNVTYTSALQSLYNSTVETYVTFDESILADTSAHAIAHYTSNCRAQILLVMRGDLNGDKAVNILDVVKVAVIYGQIGTPGWKIEDINCDGRITILDIVLVTTNYGKKV